VSEEGGSPGPEGEENSPTPPSPRRLDPDLAAKAAARRATRRAPQPVVDTRRYQRVIGLLGITLIVIISISFLTSHTPGTAGIPAGKRLHYFSAPLATSNLNGDANTNPPCTLAQHHRTALNICLLAKRAPLVMALFVTGSSGCEQQVTALQTLSHQYKPSQVQFAAVAVRTSHADARKAVKSHGWTIPVAYDADGAVGDIYGVEVCPIVELSGKGGVVANRLIGEHWASAAALGPQVQKLIKGSS
jgi:hypothetical protein